VTQRQREDIAKRTSISAWMEVEIDPETRKPYLTVKARNDTGFPLFEWSISGSDGSIHLCSTEAGPVVPDMNRYIIQSEGAPDHVHAVPLTVEFRDRLGVLWLRDRMGQVRRLDALSACPNPTIGSHGS
jgi:hypothetical protein